MKKVLVMMSTYNGEKFLKSQVESIFAQEDVSVDLIIRDDGSEDNSCNILQQYHCLEIIQGSNTGPARSFMKLLLAAAKYDYDYYALADQDDLWESKKLAKGIELMECDNADLYCGAVYVMRDNDGTLSRVSKPVEYFGIEMMLRNSVQGCTMIMNQTVLNRMVQYYPRFIEMHDSWILRVSYFTGLKIIYDEVPYMRYRINNNNVCGTYSSFYEKMYLHWKNLLRYDFVAANTARELLWGYRAYIDQNDTYLLELLEGSNIRFRKKKLIFLGIKSYFSSVYRKLVYIMEVVMGKI